MYVSLRNGIGTFLESLFVDEDYECGTSELGIYYEGFVSAVEYIKSYSQCENYIQLKNAFIGKVRKILNNRCVLLY